MKTLLGLVFNRWVLVAVLLGASSLVVWIVGPLVAIAGRAPLETENARWAGIAALVGATLLTAAWRAWAARRGNAAVVDRLVAAPPAASHGETESADLASVRERFERALATLRKARFAPAAGPTPGRPGRPAGLMASWTARVGGRYLYELPWYLIIGAPGAGKTTALEHCGLRFPLAEQLGAHAVRGVGGTRDCDWWFTDQAVLIDTAGRFTTQDSDRERDRATWSGFLKLLARSRPRQPINGALVTVALPDLLARGPADRARHAATVRTRLAELQDELGIRFPVYLLVTKCDLMAGFMDYFATLDKDGRNAPWGFTFPLDGTGAAPDPTRLAGELQRLGQRLTDGLVDRLQAEHDPARRAAIYAFPGQYAALEPRLLEFVEAAFAASGFDATALLRGVYFISGTQEGTPIDRMLEQAARAYRLDRPAPAPNRSSGKSYFLGRLLTEIVFAERGVAGTNLAWQRRTRRLAISGHALAAIVAVGGLVAWGSAAVANRRYVDKVAADTAELAALLRTTPNRASSDLLPILPALDRTRRIADPADPAAEASSTRGGFGLSQRAKLESAAWSAYRRMLVDAMQPRLALRVEEQLRQGGDAGDSQYEALKTYRMLNDPAHFDPKLLKARIERDWDARLARELTTGQRAALGTHLDALLADGAIRSPLAEDAPLVASVRAQLASVPLPQRIYQRIRQQDLSREFPDFTLTRAAGANAALVFVRASGEPLTRGVPGIYTADGYHRGFERELDRVVAELADEEGWVLGTDGGATGATGAKRPSNDQLRDEVRRLYLNDYAAAWEAYIADVRIVRLGSVAQSVQTAMLLSAPDSPLPALVKAMARETTLGSSFGANGTVDKFKNGAFDAIKAGRDKIEQAIAAKTGAPVRAATSGLPLEAIVDERFAGLRFAATAPEGGKAPIDDTVALIGQLYVLLKAAEAAAKGGAAPPPSPVPNQVLAEAARQPEPVRSALTTLAQSSAQRSQVALRESLGRDVRAQAGEFCSQAIARRYPVDPRSTVDATQADFAQLFGPGGKIDRLMTEKLLPYVDTSARPNWRFRAVDGTPLGTDLGTLPQLQRAAAIRETFFPVGATTPSMRLEFKPVEMDATIGSFILDIDGQIVRYAHGPQIPTAVQWPGPRGSSQVRVQVTGAGGSNAGMVTDGPWALLRMFDRARIEPAPQGVRATFEVDGKKAVFDVATGSVRNPFRLPELKDFACPQGL